MNTNNQPFRFFIALFQHLWFVWTLFNFALTGIIAAICYFFIFNFYQRDKAFKYSFYVTKIWAKVLMLLVLVRVRVEGAEKVEDDDNYIIISNHQSAMDIPFAMYSCPVPFSFLAKKEADNIPIIGYLARNMHVYVDRKNPQNRMESYERMKKHITSGKSIHVFAEGTRNKTDEPLLPLYDGAFRLAIETQKPLVIMTLCHANKILPAKESFKSCPGIVRCIWEEPISTVGMTLDDVDKLKELAKEKMLHNLSAAETATNAAWW